MFVGPTRGSIVRIDHWVFSGHVTDGPVWGHVVGGEDPDEVHPFEFEIIIGELWSSLKEMPWGPGQLQWVNAHDDRWEIVADADVPDEVWVALAKLRLAGE